MQSIPLNRTAVNVSFYNVNPWWFRHVGWQKLLFVVSMRQTVMATDRSQFTTFQWPLHFSEICHAAPSSVALSQSAVFDICIDKALTYSTMTIYPAFKCVSWTRCLENQYIQIPLDPLLFLPSKCVFDTLLHFHLEKKICIITFLE